MHDKNLSWYCCTNNLILCQKQSNPHAYAEQFKNRNYAPIYHLTNQDD